MDKPLKGKARAKKLRDLIRQVGLTCGAHSRNSGQPCKLPPISLTSGNGRCKYHGGMSTGPVTPEGIARWRIGISNGGKVTAERRRLARAERIALE